ncbi:MAG: GNAT family N-acetyltransferase [Geminicoccaceae bacterium]
MTAGNALVIRTALVADVAACARLFAAGQQEIEPRAPPWRETEFGEQVTGEEILVAACGSEVVGFLSLWRPEAFVHFLHVTTSWRRRGVGRRLLCAARDEVRRPLELKCLAANRAALSFYRHLGWQPTGTAEGTAAPYVRLRQPR